MADPHITLRQWNEADALGGQRHEVGETGDWSHLPDLADHLLAQGVVGVNPAFVAQPTEPDSDAPEHEENF